MLAGDPMLRSATGMQKQICHRCFSTINQVPFGGAPCTGDDTASFPTKMCQGGIRSTVTFPTFVCPFLFSLPFFHIPFFRLNIQADRYIIMLTSMTDAGMEKLSIHQIVDLTSPTLAAEHSKAQVCYLSIALYNSLTSKLQTQVPVP